MLQDRIAEWLDLADRRNISPDNPITIIVENEGEKFYVCISYHEPHHVTLPLNVTWIVADTESPNYGRALRRVSTIALNGYRNSWVQLQVEQDIWDELQFWDISASFQLGEVQLSATGNATHLVRGFFKLENPPPVGTEDDPVVVGSNDPRMSDARQPLPHEHTLLPYIALEGSTGINEFSVIINTGPTPTPGQILAISHIDPETNEIYGSFVTPTLAMIDYDGPTFDSLVITSSAGATTNESTTVLFTATANFSNGSSQTNLPALWSVIAGQAYGNINASTGQFTANDIVGDQVVRIRAEWTHTLSGQNRSQTFDLTVVDTTVTAVLVGIEIQGIANINEGGNTTPFVVVASYDDNTTRAITPTTFTNSNSGAGSLNASTGIFTSASNVSSDQTTVLSATYTENGVTVSDTHTITVIDTTVYPQSATIIGPSNVSENSTAQYALEVLFTDGSTSQVAVTNWSSSNSAAGSIDPVTGVFTTPTNLDATETTVLSATFTQNNVTVTGNRSIQALDTTIYPLSATVLGAASVNEGASSTYQLRVTFSDNTTQIVPVTNWTSDNPTAAVIGATTGVLTAGSVSANTAVNISASYTAAGETVGGTIAVNIIDTTLYPISLTLLGNPTMNENTTQTLTARVTYSDNSTAIVPATYVSSNTAAATVGVNSGIVTAAVNLQASASTTITGSYTENGVTRTGTFNITVQDSTIYPASATILGLATVSEGTTTQYQLRVTYTNGSNQIVTVNNWALSNPAAGSITTGGLLTTPEDVTGNVSANITASYTLDGVTRNASLAITVTDDTIYPVSATIIGPNSVNEGATQTYTLRVDFSDATNTVVAVSDWESSDTAVGTIGSSDGIFTALEQVGNGTTTISASYTSENTTVSADLELTVVDTTNYPVSAVIVGSASVNENTSTTFVFRVTFTDSSTSDVAITNWASSNSSAGVINASTGVFSATANVTSNVNTTISGSYTANGETVNATLPITVVDTTNYPVSAVVNGPSAIDELETATYTLSVTFTDSSTSVVSVTDWASSNNAAGVIDASSGEFVAAENNTGANVSTTLTATYTANGQTVTGTRSISVRDTTVYPTSATIEGPTSANEGASPIQYNLRINYSNGTNSLQPATSWSATNASAGSIDSNGLFTLAANIIGAQASTITATYTSNGQTVSDTHSLNVVDTVIKPVSLVISGPATHLENAGNASYSITVTNDNASTSTPTTGITWSHSNSSAGTINATTGVFTPANVTANQATVITASYTANGVTVTNTRNLNVVYVMIPTSAQIVGPTSIAEGSAATNYQLRVFFDNGTNDIYAVNTWANSNASAGSIGASSGTFTVPANVTQNQNTNITASYTQNGATVNATLAVTVTNAVNRPASAEILGVGTIVETNSTTFQFRVTYEDGSQSLKTITNWANTNATAGSIVAGTGVFTAASVNADQNTTISGSFTEHGVTVSDTHALTVTNTVSTARVRWGKAQFSDTDFTGGKTNPNQAGTNYEVWTGIQQFMTDEITTTAVGNGPHNIILSIPFEPAPLYGYFAHPAWMGTYRFTDNSTTFDGSWDGASWQDGSLGDGPGEHYGPVEVMYNDGSGAELWKIYRTDFSGLDNINFTATKLP